MCVVLFVVQFSPRLLAKLSAFLPFTQASLLLEPSVPPTALETAPVLNAQLAAAPVFPKTAAPKPPPNTVMHVAKARPDLSLVQSFTHFSPGVLSR